MSLSKASLLDLCLFVDKFFMPLPQMDQARHGEVQWVTVNFTYCPPKLLFWGLSPNWGNCRKEGRQIKENTVNVNK